MKNHTTDGQRAEPKFKVGQEVAIITQYTNGPKNIGRYRILDVSPYEDTFEYRLETKSSTSRLESELQPLAEEKKTIESRPRLMGKSTFVEESFKAACKANQPITYHAQDYVCMDRKSYEKLISKDTAHEEWEVHKPIIDMMRTNGFRLMKDGNTFYQQGYELNPRMGICFDMHQAYQIANMLKARDKRAVEILEEIRKSAGLCLDAANNQLEKQRTSSLFKKIQEAITAIRANRSERSSE